MTVAGQDTVTLNRNIKAPVSEVYDAWTDAKLLQGWLAAKAHADARVGGRVRLEVPDPQGTHVVTGEYRQLVPDRLIIMTWTYEGPLSPSGPMEALLTIDLRAHGSQTQIAIRHEGLTSPPYREAIANGAWNQALDKLQVLLT